MSYRIAAPAAPGSLFKQPAPVRKKKLDMGRKPRERDEEHLEAIRQCPCLKCGIDPAGEAAHIRISSAAHGKPNAGIGNKPDDKFTLPLCHQDHMEQHALGESSFWADVGIPPLKMAESLYRLSPNTEAMRAACFVARTIAEAT
jgi:hypothetical protein